MPFSQPLSHSPPYIGPAQVGRRACTARNVLVQKTILEPGVERGREALASQEGVRSCLFCARVSVGRYRKGGITLNALSRSMSTWVPFP
jgi:hypothetical protein